MQTPFGSPSPLLSPWGDKTKGAILGLMSMRKHNQAINKQSVIEHSVKVGHRYGGVGAEISAITNTV